MSILQNTKKSFCAYGMVHTFQNLYNHLNVCIFLNQVIEQECRYFIAHTLLDISKRVCTVKYLHFI